MATPVIIVSGFLGSGKTTFLRHLLPLCGEVGLRPILVINEVGDADVDGELLADLHAEQARLVGGCVCCTLQGQLAATIADALARDAGDVIIIECSGLSNPLDVLYALSTPDLLHLVAVSHVVCLVDTGRAGAILQVVELAKTQITTADILIINKLDKVSAEKQAATKTLIDGLAPQAVQYWTNFGDIGHDALRSLLTDPAPTHAVCGEDHAHCTHHHAHAHTLPASFCTVAVTLPPLVERHALESLLRALPENIIRGKGFANITGEGWHVLHRVYDSIDITPFYGNEPAIGPVLICIGLHLSADTVTALVDDLLEIPAHNTRS